MSDEVDFVGYSPRPIAEASCRAFCIARAIEMLCDTDAKAETIIAFAAAMYDYIMPEGWAADQNTKRKTALRAVEVKRDD